MGSFSINFEYNIAGGRCMFLSRFDIKKVVSVFNFRKVIEMTTDFEAKAYDIRTTFD